jgi:uncharacterized FlgJ-related protein
MPLISLAPMPQGIVKESFERYYESRVKEFEIKDRITEIKNMKFTISLLEEYIDLVDPSLMDVPMRQFILETGWFQSELFTEYNNIAGMKYPYIRKTTAAGTALGYARYNHWTDSVDDYIHWRDHWMSKGYSTKDYYDFLKDINYSISSSYEILLKNIQI